MKKLIALLAALNFDGAFTKLTSDAGGTVVPGR